MESTNPIINKNWQEVLERQGVDFKISETFLNIPNLKEASEMDKKTGLPIENDQMRSYLANRLSQSIINGENWAMIHTDADNLKLANTRYDRNFGDTVIKHGAALASKAVNEMSLGKNVEVIATMQERAADELDIWLFGLSTEELNGIAKGLSIIETPTKTENPDFTFSISASTISSIDPRIKEKLNETKHWLLGDGKRIAYDFYQHDIKGTADTDVNQKKIENDLDRLKNLPEDQLLTDVSMEKFISSIVETFGNSRISDKLLEVLLKLTSAQTAIAMSKNLESKIAYIKLLEEVGITKEQIGKAKTIDNLLSIFRDLFGS